MIELALPEAAWHELSASLAYDGAERCAVLLANEISRPSHGIRLLSYETIVPTASEYARSGPLEAELNPAFVARVTKMALSGDYSIVFVHSHAGSSTPTFSRVDDFGERRLAEFLAHRHPSRVHVAMVVSSGGTLARRLGGDEPCTVVSVGDRRIVQSRNFDKDGRAEEMFDRQVRAIGAAGQRAFGELAIGIVGLGGTGSIVAQQLVHLGARRFILVDPDTIEVSNLNRVVGAIVSDVGKAKVHVAQRYISAFAPSAQVSATIGDVIWARDGRVLLDADLIFCCTDSHGSRAVLEQICYQFLVPLIDLGSVIEVGNGELRQVTGRVQMLGPGLACFTCSRLLNPDQVRRDMMTAFERQSDPYIQGARESMPAVISLNGTVASLAVTIGLAVITGIPIPARHLIYRALLSSLRAVTNTPEDNCLVCSRYGRLARGDSYPFPGRQD